VVISIVGPGGRAEARLSPCKLGGHSSAFEKGAWAHSGRLGWCSCGREPGRRAPGPDPALAWRRKGGVSGECRWRRWKVSSPPCNATSCSTAHEPLDNRHTPTAGGARPWLMHHGYAPGPRGWPTWTRWAAEPACLVGDRLSPEVSRAATGGLRPATIAICPPQPGRTVSTHRVPADAPACRRPPIRLHWGRGGGNAGCGGRAGRVLVLALRPKIGREEP